MSPKHILWRKETDLHLSEVSKWIVFPLHYHLIYRTLPCDACICIMNTMVYRWGRFFFAFASCMSCIVGLMWLEPCLIHMSCVLLESPIVSWACTSQLSILNDVSQKRYGELTEVAWGSSEKPGSLANNAYFLYVQTELQLCCYVEHKYM